jgi:hypothetical protein
VRFAFVLGVLGVCLALWASGAVALFPDSGVQSYAGCLNMNGSAAGTFSQVAQGDTPGKACSSNQTTVHLSGGDITKVTAGSGLSGGGDNGAVTLALGSGYSLPQTCSSGQVPTWNGTSWGCSPGLPGSSSCSSGQVASWNGTSWACTPGLPGSCSFGEVPSWKATSSSWVCTPGLPQNCGLGKIPVWSGSDWQCGTLASKGYAASNSIRVTEEDGDNPGKPIVGFGAGDLPAGSYFVSATVRTTYAAGETTGEDINCGLLKDGDKITSQTPYGAGGIADGTGSTGNFPQVDFFHSMTLSAVVAVNNAQIAVYCANSGSTPTEAQANITAVHLQDFVGS